MRKVLQRTLWTILALAVGLGILLEARPQSRGASRLEALPLAAFGFVGRDVPLTDTEKSFFRQARVMKRLYQAGASRFVLIAVDGGADRHAIHDPLYCFRGAGWAVAGDSVVPLPGGYGRVLKLRKGTEKAEAMYWFSDGQERHSSAVRLWWQSVLRRVRLDAGGDSVLVILQPASGFHVDWANLSSSCPALFRL